jgi:hypothetical protein
MQMELNNPIFITGIERSGSTIVAKVVNHCGAFAGKTTEMLENIDIKHLLNLYYISLKIDVRGQFPLPNTKELNIPIYWKQKVEDILRNDTPFNWMLKGSRLCQTWPIWHYTFPNAKWIIVRRRTPDIIESCLKTGYMTAYKDKEGWLGWVHQHEKLFMEMIEAGLNCKQVWPERMASGDYQQIKEIIEWLGLPWNEEIPKLIDPLLWNSKQRKEK